MLNLEKDEAKQEGQPEQEAAAALPEIPPCPADPKVPLTSGVARLARSSKALVVLGAIVVVAYLANIGKVPGEDALAFVKWLLLAYLGAVAIEDGARKFAGRSGTDPARASWIIQLLAPAISMAAQSLKRAPSEGAPGYMAPMEGSAAAVPPMTVVPISNEQIEVLIKMAAEQGKPPGPFIDKYVQQAIEEKLKAGAKGPPRPAKDK